MSKLSDWPPHIKQSEFDKFFSAYKNSSPLESVLTPEQINAVANFNANRRSPGMAEEAIPGIEPTFVPRPDVSGGLQPRPWLVSMQGEGPRFQQEPASMQTWVKKQAESEAQQAREQKAIMVLVASNPTYFIGRPPESFVSKKEAEAHLKNQKDLEHKGEELREKIRAHKAAEAAKPKKTELGDFLPSTSTGTVTGGGKTDPLGIR